MTRGLVIGASLAALFGLGGSALAQTYSADDGDPAVTEPGGTMGRNGAENVRQGQRDGEAVGVPPGASVGDDQVERRGSPRPPGEPR